ncbi:MAG: hypothetical protein M1835_001373 [Candelina submexicana]|nr:MAG: hypothetical protein M1835_001373 [Candelina submexicana]
MASNFTGNAARGSNPSFHSAFDGLLNPERNTGGRMDNHQFEIFDWFPQYQSCQRYFLDHAQYSGPVQAVAAFLNISLPFQKYVNPVLNSSSMSGHSPGISTGSNTYSIPSISSSPHHGQPSAWVSLVPYLRRLVVTAMDYPGILHGFFGDDWAGGVGPLHEQERRNYLFAAKSGGWASVKRDYDMLPLETVPFLRPLQGPVDAEIEAAEKSWSEWLAMEDWMVGPRAPESMGPLAQHGRGRDERP